MEILDETGEYLVKLARTAAKSWITKNERITPISPIPEQAKLTTGAFVTVKRYTAAGDRLRGCIGYIEGIAELYNEIIDLSKSSTLEDPRFPPMLEKELDSVIFEVTVLTIPENINYSTVDELLAQITIGEDGLIVEKGNHRGLLLPQVPIEQGWNEEEFISYTCRKAFLSVDTWKKEVINVKKFQGIIFSEQTPNGAIIRKSLNTS